MSRGEGHHAYPKVVVTIRRHTLDPQELGWWHGIRFQTPSISENARYTQEESEQISKTTRGVLSAQKWTQNGKTQKVKNKKHQASQPQDPKTSRTLRPRKTGQSNYSEIDEEGTEDEDLEELQSGRICRVTDPRRVGYDRLR